MPGLVTLGEPLIGLVAQRYGPLAEADTFSRHVTGAELNVAVGIARLGHPAAYIGRVGADGFGTTILRRLRAEGVDVSAVTIDPHAPTGLLVREKRVLGPAEVEYYRARSAGSRLDRGDVEAAASIIAAADWLHVTGITPALSVTAFAAVKLAIELARSADHRPTISLDANIRRKLWSEEEAAPILRSLIGSVDIVFCGLDEAEVILGHQADRAGADASAMGAQLLALGVTEAVIKLGSRGAVSVSHDRGDVRGEGLDLDFTVDPIGAGDGFCAGFIAARLDAQDVAQSLAWAVACGASVAASDGDLVGLPSRLELARLVDGPRDTIR